MAALSQTFLALLIKHLSLHRPTHATAREQADHRRHIEPDFRDPDVSEVCDPGLVRLCRSELTIEHIRRDDRGKTGTLVLP